MTCDLRGQRILRVSTWVVSSENRGVSQFQWILIIFAIPTAILGVTPHLQMDPNLISSWLVASQCISIYFEKKVQKQLPNETPIYGIIYIYIYYVPGSSDEQTFLYLCTFGLIERKSQFERFLDPRAFFANNWPQSHLAQNGCYAWTFMVDFDPVTVPCLD